MSFLLSPLFSLQQNQRTRGQKMFCSEAGSGVEQERGQVAQTMHIHVNKYKNNKIKEKN
jgi:hypothetical protein